MNVSGNPRFGELILEAAERDGSDCYWIGDIASGTGICRQTIGRYVNAKAPKSGKAELALSKFFGLSVLELRRRLFPTEKKSPADRREPSRRAK